MFFFRFFYRILFFTVSALILSSTISLPAFSSETDLPVGIFRYSESLGTDVSYFTWQAKQDDSEVMISVTDNEKIFYNLCANDGSTYEWKLNQGIRHDLTAKREGNTIHIQGKRFSKKYDAQIEIDERPWYQPLSFSLGKFLESDLDSTSFWVIRVDTIELIPLTAKRLGEETITVEGRETLTEKIEVRAQGYKSRFWHATYWFRKEDKLFVRYQSIHGLPGTEETIITLIESPNTTES